MNLEGYIACICEGSAEQAIMELLLEKNRLIFSDDRLLGGEIIRCRNAKMFEMIYLRKGFNEKITILRVLDSRREQFTLSKAYVEKIEVINVITAPEIEILIIMSEGKYDEFKSSGVKPSEFCKVRLKYRNVKSYEFVRSYFSDEERLIKAILEYKRVSKSRKGELSLADLIRL